MDDSEKLKQVEEYNAVLFRIEQLRFSLHGTYGHLGQLEGNLESAEDYYDIRPMIDNVARSLGDVKSDLDCLSRALEHRRQLEDFLEDIGLNSLIKRP